MPSAEPRPTPWPAGWAGLDEIAAGAARLRAGGLVAFATETVYGLGADATQPEAVAEIFRAKGRPADHPVIVHLSGADQLGHWIDPLLDHQVRSDVDRLAAALWPGPLTLVVPRNDDVSDAVTGGRDTVGLRVPDHPLALQLLRLVGTGVAAPSANRFGRVSPTSAADVRGELGDRAPVVLDGGPCRVGLESTIVELVDRRPTILRPGGVPAELIDQVLGRPAGRVASGPSRASGMLASHYAPTVGVELVDADDLPERARLLIGQGKSVGVSAGCDVDVAHLQVTHLVRPARTDEVARELYRTLRDADDLALDVLLVATPTATDGLGEAVLDRLRKAAAPRP